MLHELQNFFLSVSPGLLPLMAFPFSLAQGWHCAAMCGPGYAMKTREQKLSYLNGRMISYMAAGAFFGALGEQLKHLLEFKILGALAFIIFIFLTLAMVFSWFGVKLFPTQISAGVRNFLSKRAKPTAFVQGLLSVTIPCHFLYQIFAMAALSKSLIGGALIAMAHVLVTTGVLWYSVKGYQAIQSRFQKFLRPIQFVILMIAVLNLFYFAGVLFYSEPVAQSKTLFCF